MYVASLELCKELYELSGWDDIEFQWSSIDGKHWEAAVSVLFAGATEVAYDLGYLLRKLPPVIQEDGIFRSL